MQRLKCKNRFAVRTIVGDGQDSPRVAATSCVVRSTAKPLRAAAVERKAQSTVLLAEQLIAASGGSNPRFWGLTRTRSKAKSRVQAAASGVFVFSGAVMAA